MNVHAIDNQGDSLVPRSAVLQLCMVWYCWDFFFFFAGCVFRHTAFKYRCTTCNNMPIPDLRGVNTIEVLQECH